MKSEALTADQFTTTQLAAKAQEAYEQKRMKECIELSRALLLADPDNEMAHKLLTAVHADMQRDIDDARALIAEAKTNKQDGQKYRKAAEIILRKILHLDPTNEEAMELMSGKLSPQAPPPTVRAETSFYQAPGPAPVDESSRMDLSRSEELFFTAQPKAFEIPKETSRQSSLPVFAVLAVLAALGIAVFVWSGRGTAIANRVTTTSQPVTPRPAPEPPAKPSAPPVAEQEQAPAAPSVPVTAPPVTAAAPVAATPPPPTPPPPAAADPVGTLAVSSPVPADIYLKDRYLGSTPTSLMLPAGRHTLEYRYGDLSTSATHNIRPNQTVTAAVTFQITVQINARPWAQVFLEGTTRRALGQTPLSSVRVPIGSVLTFENPNFATKTHKITGSDSAIFVDFQ